MIMSGSSHTVIRFRNRRPQAHLSFLQFIPNGAFNTITLQLDGMKTSTFRSYILSLSLFGAVVICSSCGPKYVDGVYRRSSTNLVEKIVLRPDGTSEQEIVYRDGTKFNRTNTWSRRNSAIEIRGFYMTFDAVSAKECQRPQPVSVATLQIKDSLLIIYFKQGYYFQKLDSDR